ncbi:nitroreductase family protein [Alkaliphilus transvaalensis]|uniref:nitroreductase family protein n=1 Tax=Alkaliphilus transvaalensis TaxID=114628 RepID=UPI00047E2ED9|nr:nitroreductase family protein [Alkaliphilus transvaalensis]
MRYRWLIENRISTRDFQELAVDRDKFLQLISYSGEIEGLIPEIKTQFIFIADGKKKTKYLEGKVGYGGHLVTAPHYVGLVSEVKPQHLQNASYQMEELLLKATELDLGSCWLSIEDGDKLKKHLDLNIDGELVALAAIGYPKLHKPYTPKSTSTRMALHEFVYFEKWGTKPITEDIEMRGLANILYHTRMAPSWKNQQPWKLIIDGEEIILVVGGEDVPEKNLLLDSGIMMLYLERIFNEAGFKVKWQLYDDDLKEDYEKYCIPDNYRIIGSLYI